MPHAGHELLTSQEMAEADARAVATGVPSLTLMENAGRAVADTAQSMVVPGRRIAVLCGPGNNGGDGYVAARVLAERGWEVDVYALRPITALRGDAAIVAHRWSGPIRSLEAPPLDGTALIIDALFGTGLTRPLAAADETAIRGFWAAAAGKPILAVDVPSGVDPTAGTAQEWTRPATRTVTFFRRKTGHLLWPARGLSGQIVVADIGIPARVLDDIRPRAFVNGAPRAAIVMPWLAAPTVHKYERGHAVVVSGPAHATGAGRLAARGALRAGAGLVTVAAPQAAVAANAAHLTAIMIAPFEAPHGLATVLEDRRKNAVLLGPGLGLGDDAAAMVAIALRSQAAVVLDADALTCFAGNVTALLSLIAKGGSANREVVLTPHEGEFSRLMGKLPGSKLDRARALADATKAVVVLKGPDTVIARPDGVARINENAPPYLATAGSGDVLAGMITGLLAQGLDAFDAASAAVWLHGACANRFGPGLIAEDIPEALPAVLSGLIESQNTSSDR